ncbi:MAG: UDP-N-acetylglucosamine 1-carboxyvinyltransferase [Clostridium fessum]
MAFIEIHGPCRIQGGLTVQGSKNAVLPIMAASVLNRGITVLENVPRIQDVFCMMGILDSLGCRCALHGNRLEIDTSKMNGWRIGQKAMGKMRSSIMLWERSWDAFARRGSTAPADV